MRSLATLLVGLLLLLLQSTVMEFAPVHLVTPTLGLLTVLYIGLSPLKWAPGAAALVGLSLGYLFDLVSGAPRGVHAFVFLVMALFARVLAEAWCSRRRRPSWPACFPPCSSSWFGPRSARKPATVAFA